MTRSKLRRVSSASLHTEAPTAQKTPPREASPPRSYGIGKYLNKAISALEGQYYRFGTALLCLLLGAAVIAAFGSAVNHGFVNYDDPDYVTLNSRVQSGLSWNNVVWAFQTNYAANWHPITWISHMLDCQVFGLRAWGHHLTSLLLHSSTTVIVFLLFTRMTGSVGASFVLAAIFGVHPLRVESVVWVSERKDVLGAFFGVLAVWFYASWCRPLVRRGRRTAIKYWLAVLFFALSLMSKATFVTLPFVLLLLDYWPLRRFQLPFNRRRNWPLVVEKIPFFVEAIAAATITFLVQRSSGAMATSGSNPILMRIANAVVSYYRYLGNLFLPTKLAVFYPLPKAWPAAQLILSGSVILGVSVLAIWMRRQKPYLLTGWLWFLGTAVPMIGIIQVGEQAMADRYTYLPLIGATIPLVWITSDVVKRRLWLIGMALIAFVYCFVLTRKQVGYWADSETLFRRTIAVTERNSVAHGNLGMALLDEGRNDEALSKLKTSVELSQGSSEAHLSLGVAFERTGDLQKAIAELKKAIEIEPRSYRAFLESGITLNKIGRLNEAVSCYEQALRLKPDYVEAHINLGAALEKLHRTDEAAAHYEKAAYLDPASAEAHLNLGNLYYQLDRNDEAYLQFQQAVKLKPGWAQAHNDLGGALFIQGKVDQAISEYERALKLDPNCDQARQNLAGVRRAKELGKP